MIPTIFIRVIFCESEYTYGDNKGLLFEYPVYCDVAISRM